MFTNSSKGDSSVDGGYFSLDLRNILSLRPRKKANSSSAAGIPPFSQAIATAGTLGKVVFFFFLPSVFEINDRRYFRGCFSLSLSSETVIDNVDFTFYLKFSWIYQIT